MSLGRLSLLFPGQGSQYVGMCKDIASQYPSISKLFSQADSILRFNLSNLMFNGPIEQLTQTEYCQPAILIHSVAVFKVLQNELGFDSSTVSCMVGHSLGEYSALVCGNSLKFEDAVSLVHKRGLLMKESTRDVKTKMSAVIVTPNKILEIQEILNKIDQNSNEVCDIANINSSNQIVLSGTEKGVSNAVLELKKAKLARKSIDLQVSAPFHSRLMKSAADSFKLLLNETNFKNSEIPFISNVTAKPETKGDQIRNLLYQQMYSPVKFHQCINQTKELNVTNFLEMGPGSVLTNLVSKDFPNSSSNSIGTIEQIETFSKT